MSRTSSSQFEVIVDFMERNGDLNKPGEGPHGRITAINKWEELSNALNMDTTGTAKPVEKWKKVWSDLKNNTKRKASKIYRAAVGTGGGPASKLILTDLEQRVLTIIGPQAATGLINVDEVGLESWTVSAILINMFGQGMLLSYTTTLLPALRDPASPIRADLNTASYLSSSVGLAGIPGFFISSILMDLCGRRIAHALVVIPGLFGWLLIFYAYNIPMLMAGRILGGITAGATVSLGAIAIGEYTSPKYRGMFLNLKTAAVCMGGMCVHILGNYLTWRTIAMCATTPHALALLIILTWPESPAWLAAQGEFDKCEASFYWLRGKDETTYKELEELIRAQMIRVQASPNDATFSEKLVEFFMKFTRKDFLKPCFILFFSTVLLEACGRHIFPAYALQIIEEITGSKTQSFYFTLGIDLIIVTSSVSSSVLVRIMKRRTLLFFTGFAAFFVLMTVCTYIFLASRDIISKDTTVPIALFVLYFILANLGCTPIPLALLGELYPLAHRGVGSTVSGIVISLCVMAGLQLTPHLLVSIKVYGTFAVFGCIMGVALVVLFFSLPETKDRTLQEIEDYFNYGRFKKRESIDEEVKVKMIS